MLVAEPPPPTGPLPPPPFCGTLMVKLETSNGSETFPRLSVTIILQSEYVAGAKVLNVIWLLPTVAEAVVEAQEPW